MQAVGLSCATSPAIDLNLYSKSINKIRLRIPYQHRLLLKKWVTFSSWYGNPPSEVLCCELKCSRYQLLGNPSMTPMSVIRSSYANVINLNYVCRNFILHRHISFNEFNTERPRYLFFPRIAYMSAGSSSIFC